MQNLNSFMSFSPVGVEGVPRLDPDVAVLVRDVGRHSDGREGGSRPGARQQDGHLAQEHVALRGREQLAAPAANPPAQKKLLWFSLMGKRTETYDQWN